MVGFRVGAGAGVGAGLKSRNDEPAGEDACDPSDTSPVDSTEVFERKRGLARISQAMFVVITSVFVRNACLSPLFAADFNQDKRVFELMHANVDFGTGSNLTGLVRY